MVRCNCGRKPLLNRKELLLGAIYSGVIFIGILAIAGFYKKTTNVLPILEHPDPFLRRVAEPITHIDASIISLTDDMIATLRYQALVDFFFAGSRPRGLAAPQVGISKRLILCGLNGRMKLMINPTILEKRGAYSDKDGCLSVQGDSETLIERSAYVRVRYKTLDNKEKILAVKNDAAALVEHEIDHLNGVLNIDY
jgi:peptide deformylase